MQTLEGLALKSSEIYFNNYIWIMLLIDNYKAATVIDS